MDHREPTLPPRARRLFRLALRRPSSIDAQVDDEIATHLAQRVDHLMARGMSRDAAVAESLRRFGDLTEARAILRHTARRREERLYMREHLATWGEDITYAVRQVARSRALAISVALTFAIGIGANATMFGIVDQLLLSPPAHVEDAESLYRPETTFRLRSGDVVGSASSYPQYLDIRDGVPGFADVAMQTFPNPISMGVGSDARIVQHQLVSGNYFRVLGTRMFLGRPLLPDDDLLPSGRPVIVISWGMWQREFGGDPAVLGREVRLASRMFTIVGIAPANFVGTHGRKIDLWIPVSAADGIRFAGANWATSRNTTWMTLIGRIRPGVSPQVVAEQATAAVWAGRTASGAKVDSTQRFRLASVLPARQERWSREARVAVLLAAVSALVLLIACANIANLLLVRALRRRREISIRLALGISRARLLRQLTLESVVLATIGGLGALVIVRWGSGIVQGLLVAERAWRESPVSHTVLALTAGATLLVGVAAGLVPAWQVSAPSLVAAMRDGTHGAGLTRSRMRSALVAGQAMLAVILLVGTGLFVRSLHQVEHVDPGVDMDRLLLGTIDLPSVGIDSSGGATYFEAVADQLRATPGVARVTIAEAAPFTNWSYGSSLYSEEGDSLPPQSDGPYRHMVGTGYFETVGTRVLRGRTFLPAEHMSGGEPTVMLNEAAAQAIFRGRDPIGACVRLERATSACVRVVGVVENTMRQNLTGGEAPLQVYQPFPAAQGRVEGRSVLVRAAGNNTRDLVPTIRRVMQSERAGLPSANVRPMVDLVADEKRPWQLGAMMFTVFGAIALMLATIGLYAVVSFVVAQRTHEVGIRVALGATPRAIVRLIVEEGVTAPSVGLVFGILLSVAGGPMVAPLLFRTSPTDPAVLLGVAAAILAVALGACVFPALRATRADPARALRAD